MGYFQTEMPIFLDGIEMESVGMFLAALVCFTAIW
jgi:hypothetical protein